MKILFLTGSRGEWGYIRPILRACREHGHRYSICATNMHLLSSHGNTVDEIVADGFEVSDRIYMAFDGHDRTAQAKSLGAFLLSFVDVATRIKPDWILLAGDRGEQLMGAVAAAYLYAPVAHVQAGELSGNIDGVARHAIGKFVHLHFAANADAATRLERLGEDPWRIHQVGAPQLDDVHDKTPIGELSERLSIDLARPYILAVEHPVTEEMGAAGEQASIMLAALARFGLPKVWVLPNNDAGADRIRRAIRDERSGESYAFANLRRADYLGLMAGAAVMVGNSSSGLIEAPTFGLPVVNIGRRQDGRVRGANVIDVRWDVDAIADVIRVALTPGFRAMAAGHDNPYGDGHSAERIIAVLESTRRDDRLLVKQLTY